MNHEFMMYTYFFFIFKKNKKNKPTFVLEGKKNPT